ncbi:hypothetical protein M432DRAFT_75954 [Thermoascus aurantiacus ATCC 26904]
MGLAGSRYRLKVTAGPEYDPRTHQTVPVNQDETLRLENAHAIVSLCVRVQNYTGFPSTSPPTHPYFSHPLHTHDQYSIAISLVPKHPISGDDLIFGNDFERPIRDRLPPGFNTALRLVKWTLDPALDGDAYADKPYLYSPALASWNQFRIGNRIRGTDEVLNVHDKIIEEGAERGEDGDEDEDDGEKVRKGKYGVIPDTVEGRRKFFLDEKNRKRFVFEPGRVYLADFGNPYIVFNDFSLRLPGFSLQVTKYIDEKNHELRYTLKNRRTGVVYFVVMFTLIIRGSRAEHDQMREEERARKGAAGDGGGGDENRLGRFDWEPQQEQKQRQCDVEC